MTRTFAKSHEAVLGASGYIEESKIGESHAAKGEEHRPKTKRSVFFLRKPSSL